MAKNRKRKKKPAGTGTKRDAGRTGAFEVAVIHLGCAKNQVDTERLMGVLASGGYTLTGRVEEADAVLLTTCAFIKEAVEETEDVIENLLALKAGRGSPLIAVAGCFTDRFGAQELAGRFPGIDLWISGADYLELPGKMRSLLSQGKGESSARRGTLPPQFERRPRFPATLSYAYIKVAEGCSNRCNYCTIPLIRGPYCAVPASVLLEEARSLSEMGAKELVLVAQDVARYEDPGTGRGLPWLVERLSALDGVEWIRLMYLHPAHIEQVMDVFTVSGKVLPYADLPVQHASDKVLKAMGRSYSAKDLRRIMERLRSVSGRMVLRTTVMTGHPGEGEEEFSELMRFMKDVEFLYLGAFPYSREEGTVSAGMPGSVDTEVATRRLRKVMEQQQEITFRLLDGCSGREVSVINEGEEARAWFQAPEVDGLVLGETPWPGGISKAVITGRSGYDLTGKPAVKGSR